MPKPNPATSTARDANQPDLISEEPTLLLPKDAGGKGRAWRTPLMVSASLVVLGLIFSGWAHRKAARLTGQGLRMGVAMAAAELAVGEPRQRTLLINGMPLFLKTVVRDREDGDFLDAFAARCDADNEAILRRLTRNHWGGEAMAKALVGLSQALRFRGEHHGGCIELQQGIADVGELWERLTNAVSSGDISELGGWHFAIKPGSPSASEGNNRAFYAEFSSGPGFSLAGLEPKAPSLTSEGRSDAPGMLLDERFRPSRAQHLATFAEVGAPDALTIFSTEADPASTLRDYAGRLTRIGVDVAATRTSTDGSLLVAHEGGHSFFVIALPPLQTGDGTTVAVIKKLRPHQLPKQDMP